MIVLQKLLSKNTIPNNYTCRQCQARVTIFELAIQVDLLCLTLVFFQSHQLKERQHNTISTPNYTNNFSNFTNNYCNIT